MTGLSTLVFHLYLSHILYDTDTLPSEWVCTFAGWTGTLLVFG